MSDLNFLPAHQIARAIKERTISSTEILEACLTQISKHNPKFNAICTLDEERAREKAKQADEAIAKGENWGPLHGVPITIKDIFETAGLRTTAGYKPLKNYMPEGDAAAVARLRGAGAIIFAKTNPAELAGDYQSSNDLFGRVNNPWNLHCTAGGSSGGSAAAVAAGFSPLELGDDFGGSIRQPAHFCGVFGLKPTDRRVSTAGHIPEVPGMPKCIRQMLTVGPLARSIEDLQLSFSLIAGSDPRQPDIPPIPPDAPTKKSLQNLRLAWMDGWKEVPVDGEIQSAMETVATKLSEVGVRVERWVPPNFDLPEIMQLYFRMAALNLFYSQPINFDTARKSLPLLFREMTQGDKELRNIGNLGNALSEFFHPTLKGYFEALTDRDRFIARMERDLEQWDGWLCPVAVTTAFTNRSKGTAIEVDGRKFPYLLANGAYTAPFNLTGHPAVAMPVGKTKAGLPVGMQIVGKRWKEMELLAIARQISDIVGDFQHPCLE